MKPTVFANMVSSMLYEKRYAKPCAIAHFTRMALNNVVLMPV